VIDGQFAMHSAVPFGTALLTLGEKKHRKSMYIKLADLHFLTYIFPLVQEQLSKYTAAMPDVMT
jgi:hypothetical protein